MPTDDSFEDREGHQAPFTLRGTFRKPNVEPKRREDVRLLCGFDLFDHSVEFWPFAGFELGMKELAIGVNFECPAA